MLQRILHIPYFFDCAAIFDIECIKNILSFCADCFFICNIISDSPHFFPVKLFCVQEHSVVQVCLIDVKVHHTRIWSSDLSYVSITESSSDLSSFTPVFDLSLYSRISTFYDTCDNSIVSCPALSRSATASPTAPQAYPSPSHAAISV